MGGGCEAALDPAAAPWGHLGGGPQGHVPAQKALSTIGTSRGGHRGDPPTLGCQQHPALGGLLQPLGGLLQPWGAQRNPPRLRGAVLPPPKK